MDFQKDLSAQILNETQPVTVLLARSISKRLSEQQRVLEREFEAIEFHERLFMSMLRSLSLKYIRTGYVAYLNFYIENMVLRKLPKKVKTTGTETLIAGVMSAAGIFSAREKADGLQQVVHMARWRAKAFLKNDYDKGEFPVFPCRPKRKGKTGL